MLKDLRKLKLQFQTAALADQAKIQIEWDGLVEKGNKTVAALEAAVGAENLTNSRYFVFHPFPQRSLTAELSWRW